MYLWVGWVRHGTQIGKPPQGRKKLPLLSASRRPVSCARSGFG